MKRTTFAGIARETVDIVDRKTYQSANGRTVDLTQSIDDCISGTRFYAPEELKRIRKDVLVQTPETFTTVIEVVNETTLAGIARVLSQGKGPVAALNFASAKNPGGGFLGGSQAQEVSLARSSALVESLLRGREYYERHRTLPSLLYSDAMILSPSCPIFRDDNGMLLDEPHLATFITSPAPNVGAIMNNRPYEMSEVHEVLRRRSELILALAASHGYRQLVLGAWGCGVFRNDPAAVVDVFYNHLRQGIWANRFERVVFSVLDHSPLRATFTAFQRLET